MQGLISVSFNFEKVIAHPVSRDLNKDYQEPWVFLQRKILGADAETIEYEGASKFVMRLIRN